MSIWGIIFFALTSILIVSWSENLVDTDLLKCIQICLIT